MSRVCIFCGTTPLTKEHLWPNWLRRQVGSKDRLDWRIEGDINGESARDHRFSKLPFDQQVRAVCAPCNGGWMSKIEAATKPLLLPLLERQGCRLNRAQQTQVATWALLKAIMFDELHPQERVVLAAHRAFLYRSKQPPPTKLWVWLGTYDGEQIGHYAYQGMLLAERGATDEPKQPTAYSVTFTFGPVAIQVAGTSLDSLSHDDVAYPQLDVARVWPASDSAVYRQRAAMTTKTLVAFSTALYDDINRRSWPPAKPAL